MSTCPTHNPPPKCYHPPAKSQPCPVHGPPAKTPTCPVHTPPDGPIYELRIYDIRPQYFKVFLGLMARNWCIRTSNSKAIGFWATEIGGISEVVHIWEYGSMCHREEARKMLADNDTWQKEFLLNFYPMVHRMENAIVSMSPGSALCTHFECSPSAVYELYTRDPKPSQPPVQLNANERLVGRFTGVYGATGTEYLLYRYSNQDAAYTAALQRRKLGETVPLSWDDQMLRIYGTSRAPNPAKKGTKDIRKKKNQQKYIIIEKAQERIGVIHQTYREGEGASGRGYTGSRQVGRSHVQASQRSDPVYELRVYYIKPDKFHDYMALMADNFDIRLQASQPLGFWTTEFGGLFEVVHIWPYDSVDHRAEVRQALAKNPEWNSKFLSKFLQYANSLQNSLLTLYPGTTLNTDFQPSPSAAYELQTVAYQGGPMPQSKEETIVARFKCIYGMASGAEYRLMRYPDAASAFVNAQKRMEGAGVISQSKLMFPVNFSALK
ncbi:hypothetical protein BaRGS_00016501 [Batillaria attramentaria]|uniref:NIPSNAP domain-containing protein n=1 Tax=Batillaria attramentaria TaxID=370345 RepID=A0ABD0KZH9_9CAEN